MAEDEIMLSVVSEDWTLETAPPVPQGRVLAKGRVFGQIGFDQEGTLGLSGRDKNATVARGDILIGGDPIDIELTNPDTGLPTLPPVLVLKGNGKGTRTTASSAGQTQSTQLL